MDSSIWVAITTGLPAPRHARHLLLQAGHLFQRHLDPEVAARHHQRIGEIDDLAEPVDGLRLLDLGHDHGAAARDLLRLGDVLRALDEGERDPVDSGNERRFQVGMVLCGERRERDRGVGQAHAFAVGQFAADLDAREDALLVGFEREKPDLAVVEQERVARRDGGEDFGMRQVHARGVAGRGIGVEAEGLVLGQRHGVGRETADPQLRALQIDQDADRPSVLGLHRANRRHQLAHALVRGVAHVDAEDVGARLEQAGDHAAV
jgi:hypothetical protein